MSSAGTCCVLLAVGLVFLSLCSTGEALNCYTCDWTNIKCRQSQTCTGNQNACVVVTIAGGTSSYGCREYSRCNINSVSADYNQENIEYRCCQKDLCNGAIADHPSVFLLLGLAVALQLMMSS